MELQVSPNFFGPVQVRVTLTMQELDYLFYFFREQHQDFELDGGRWSVTVAVDRTTDDGTPSLELADPEETAIEA